MSNETYENMPLWTYMKGKQTDEFYEGNRSCSMKNTLKVYYKGESMACRYIIIVIPEKKFASSRRIIIISAVIMPKKKFCRQLKI